MASVSLCSWMGGLTSYRYLSGVVSCFPGLLDRPAWRHFGRVPTVHLFPGHLRNCPPIGVGLTLGLSPIGTTCANPRPIGASRVLTTVRYRVGYPMLGDVSSVWRLECGKV